jgi:hypothetical protein
MHLRRKWGHLASLSGEEIRLFLRVCWMLPWVDLDLRLRGWRRCHERLAAWAAGHATRTELAPERIAWVVARAARNVPWPATCLRRSLVLWALLARAGVAAELRLGFRRQAGAFEAHAWVERNGVPLNDRRDIRTQYTVAEQALIPSEWRED